MFFYRAVLEKQREGEKPDRCVLLIALVSSLVLGAERRLCRKYED